MKMFYILSLLLLWFPSVYSQNQIELKLKLKDNKTYRISTAITNSMTLTVDNQQRYSELERINSLIIKPISINEEYIVTEMRFDSVGIASSNPKVNAGSYFPEPQKTSDGVVLLNCAINIFTQNVFRVKLSKFGKVVDMSDLDIYPDTLVSQINKLDGQEGDFIKDQMRTLQNVNYVKGLIEYKFAYLPNQGVLVKNKWKSEMIFDALGFHTLYKNNFRIKNIDNATLNATGVIYYIAKNTEPAYVDGATVYKDLNGLGKVEIKIDVNSGLLRSWNSKIFSEGIMNISTGGYERQIPTVMDVEIRHWGVF